MMGQNLRQTWLTSRALGVALPIIVGIIVVFLQKDQIHDRSGDLANHYAFAQDITDTWQWPRGDKPFTAGMASYPPGAHYLAAILGLAVGSPLMAINIISISCVFGCYFLLSRAINPGPQLYGLIATIIAAAGVFIARTQHASIGFEIDYNFFYSQLVAEFFFLLFVFWLVLTRQEWRARLIVSVIVAGLGAWLYMTMSFEVVVSYVAMEGMLLVRKVRQTRTLNWSWLTPAVVGAVILPLTMIFHPALHGMMNIAANNGELDVHEVNHLVPALAEALLAVAFALGVLAPDSPRWRGSILFLATASSAVAVVALLQFSAQAFVHLGSDYAVKKFAFTVTTLLAFTVGAAVATVIEAKRPSVSNQGLAITLAVCFAGIATIGMHVYPAERLDRFIAYEKQIKAAMASNTVPPNAMGHTSSRNPAFDYPLNHAATLVDLRMDMNDSLKAIDAELNPSIVGPESYTFTGDQHGTVPPNCIIGPELPKAIVLVSLQCQMGAFPGINLGEKIAVSGSPDRPPYFKSGWSVKEPGAIWSDGHEATLAMHLATVPGPLAISVDALAFLPEPGSVQHVNVRVNGALVGTWLYDKASPSGSRTVSVPASLVKDGDIMLDLGLPDATSPIEHKLSPDGRKLGIYLSAVAVVAEYPTITPGKTVSLADGPQTPPYFMGGWSIKEPTAVWSDGPDAMLNMHVDGGGGPVNVTLGALAFLPRPDYVQHVEVRAGKTLVGSWLFDAHSPSGARTVTIPASLNKTGDIQLDLRFPDATSPDAQRLGPDGRRLGLYVSSVTVSR